MAELRVLLADDHAIMRDGLRRLLQEEAGFSVVGEACDGDQLLDLAGRVDADVVLMDLAMPGPGALETLRRLQRRHPRLRVLVLTMHREPALAARVLKAGAAGYICKDSAYATVGLALRRIHAGGRFVDPDLVGGLLHIDPEAAGDERHERLSAREFEILQLIAEGRALKAIGESLALSPKTVSTYKARILEKLGLRSTAELVRYAGRHGLMQDESD